MTPAESRRQSERRAILKVLGVRGRAARTASVSGRSFTACLRELGLDVSAYPEHLTRTGPGGRSRNDTPYNLDRRRRYRALRDLGLSSAVANDASSSQLTFGVACAELL